MLLSFPDGPALLERDDGTPVALIEVRAYAGDSDEVAKADLAPNERWITLHPHGKNSEGSGVHVKIRVGPDGSGHVVSGPGELRGLRLTRLASPEELAKRKQARDAERRGAAKDKKAQAAQSAAEHERRVAEDPEYARRHAEEEATKRAGEEERAKRLADLHDRMGRLQEALLEKAATVTGDAAYTGEEGRAAIDPKAYAAYKDKLRGEAAAAAGEGDEDAERHDPDAARGAGAVIASRNVRQVRGALSHLRRHLVENLVRDADLRAAVLGEEALDTSAIDKTSVTGHPGYKRDVRGAAERAGFTEGDAKAEAESAFADRLARLAENGEAERADAIVQMRASTRARARAERELRSDEPASDGSTLNRPKPVSNVPAPRVAERAEHVRDFLKLHHELEDLQREERALRLGRDPAATDEERAALEEHDRPLPPGAEVDATVSQVEQNFVARLEAQIRDASQADLTRAFLEAVDEDASVRGYADDLIRKAMTAHVGVGAHAHLSNAALAVLGHEGLDRQVVDAFGVEASAALLAHAVRRDAPERLAEVRDGLARYHDETSLARMHDATEFARAARADAAEIEVPSVRGATDAALALDLARERKARLAEAHEALGTALGAVEAGAALNLALKGAGADKVVVRFGNAPTAGVVTQLRALGLEDGDYEVERAVDDGDLTVTLTRTGMDRLTRPLPGEDARVIQEARAIKDGAQDEADWLPAGFARRAERDLTPNPSVPAAFQAPPDFRRGAQAAVEGVAARMYADGASPTEITRHLLDVVAQDVPEGQGEAFSDAVTRLLPFAREVTRTAKDGTTYTAHEATDLDRDADVHARLGELSRGFLAQTHPGESSFHAQRVHDGPEVREALFRAIADAPALGAAFAEPGDLGGDKAGREKVRAIRGYFLRHLVGDRLGGMSPKDYDERQSRRQADALAALGPAPDKWGGGGGDLFGFGGGGGGPTTLRFSPHADETQIAGALRAHGLTPEHYRLVDGGAELNDAGKAALRVPDAAPTVSDDEGADRVITGGLDDLNPAWVRHEKATLAARAKFPTTRDLWQDFRATLGGTRQALSAVQEVMQGDLVSRFAEHHAQLTGRQLRVSKMTTDHWERRLAATNPEEAERIRRRDRALADGLRERTSSGQYAQMGEGGLAGAVREHVERMSRQKMLQGGLGFDLMGAKGGGEVTGTRVHDLDVGAHERATIGRAAESAVAHLLRSVPLGVRPGDSPVSLLRNLTWGPDTKHVGKQRGVKMLLASGRMAGFYGAGSGKTSMQIGAFTQAHAEGRAKKALLVVPSIVRNQFGEEAARFTTPGAYSWHAHDDTHEGRRAAYTGDTHMVVVTHASFRDDMLRLMADHQGVGVPDATARFLAQDREGRAATLAAALAHHGIPNDFLAVDEAHDFLNRAGKQESTMSAVLEAAMDGAKIKSLWTGSPVKNDASEVFDWLSKLDPKRFRDREDFMRRYGVNTGASAEALQRLMDGYSYVDSVTPDVQRTVTWGARGDDGHEKPLALTPEQQRAYAGVKAAFDKASAAARRGAVDVDACRTLSPASFEGAPDEQHEAIAARVQSALGTAKHAALGRVVHEFPAEHNAKVQHVLQLAGARRGRGGVIFARNRASVAMLREQLEKAGHRVGVIDGRTSTDEKARVRQRFDAGEVDIVLASDAGATGANLQKRGEWLVNYDLPPTQKTMEQRNARIDRLGQGRAIELHHLATDTPFDRDNVRRLNRKRELGAILQGEYRSMEDTGLAAYLTRARAERAGDAPTGLEEPLLPAPTPSSVRLTDDGPKKTSVAAEPEKPQDDWRARFAGVTVEWGDPQETHDDPSPMLPGTQSLFG